MWRTFLSERVIIGVVSGLVLFAMIWANLAIAHKLGPKYVPLGRPDTEILERYREFATGRQVWIFPLIAFVVAFMFGLSASQYWDQWMLFRNGGSFGISDPQFGHDIGFYLFQLPFLRTMIDWGFNFLLLSLLAAVVIHYLNGSISLRGPGERITTKAKAHLSILMALIALTQAGSYWLQRYDILTASGSQFDGAGYTAVNATLPAVQLMILISVFVGVLFLINIRRKGWVLPVTTVLLWAILALIAGQAYPAFVQRFQVDPAELAKEEQFIARNIEATRFGLGLDEIEEVPFEFESVLTREMADEFSDNIDTARLLDPAAMLPTFRDQQVERPYFDFVDVDVDRYDLESGRAPVVIAARELNLAAGMPNATWEQRHLIYTHGYAAALAPANSVNDRGEPQFLIQGIPPTVSQLPDIDKPEIYHGERMDGYAVVGTKQSELSNEDVTTRYDGESGVELNSFLRKAAFSLRFGTINMLISDNLTEESKVIFHRDVIDRVGQIAPYLDLDPDPYPVIIDGRMKYIVDGYTTTTRYPYAQEVRAQTVDNRVGGSFNYIRNSVKAVVDAYDGTTTLYLADTLYGKEDPMIRAYHKAFPGLYEEEIPEEIQAHLRYPEFMFKTQTELWGRYHQSDPSTFFNNSDAWMVGQQPSDSDVAPEAEDTGSANNSPQGAIEPYYQEMRIGKSEDSEFVLTRPYVLPSSDGTGRNLTAIMVARNDPENYGRLEEVVMMASNSSGELARTNAVDGTLQANRKMVTDDEVTQYQTFVGRNGSRIRFGNLLIIPQGNALVYMRPIYAAEESSSRYALKKIILMSGESVGFGDTIEQAMEDLLGAVREDAANEVEPEDTGVDNGDVDTPTEPETPDDPDEPAEPEIPTDLDLLDITELLNRASLAFERADARLVARDLAGYEEALAEARSYVDEAIARIEEPTPTASDTDASQIAE